MAKSLTVCLKCKILHLPYDKTCSRCGQPLYLRSKPSLKKPLLVWAAFLGMALFVAVGIFVLVERANNRPSPPKPQAEKRLTVDEINKLKSPENHISDAVDYCLKHYPDLIPVEFGQDSVYRLRDIRWWETYDIQYQKADYVNKGGSRISMKGSARVLLDCNTPDHNGLYKRNLYFYFERHVDDHHFSVVRILAQKE